MQHEGALELLCTHNARSRDIGFGAAQQYTRKYEDTYVNAKFKQFNMLCTEINQWTYDITENKDLTKAQMLARIPKALKNLFFLLWHY